MSVLPSNTLATHVWVIGNPVGGGGRAPDLLIPLLAKLEKRFVDFKPSYVEGKIAMVNTSTGPEGIARRETCSVRFTADVSDGIRIASDVARDIVKLPQEEIQRCFVVPVGGDGTLSEVIHGLSSVIIRELGLPIAFLPNIAYLAAGTGADFARIGLCCKNANDIMSLINASTFIDPSKDASIENADESIGGVRKVDVGCVTHVNTNAYRYFTNEASVGLSNAVVVSVVDFKKKKWISCFGGAAVFLAASAYELFRMTPHRFRLRKLPVVQSGASSVVEGVHCGAPPGASSILMPTESTLPVKDTKGPASAEQQKKDWDQGDWVYLDSTALVFGNGQYFGGGMKICPHGDPCDQALSIASWGETVLGYATGVPSIYNGNATAKWKTSRMFMGGRVLVELAPSEDASTPNSPNSSTTSSPATDTKPPLHAFMETDGEPIGALPAIVEISHQINFLLPLPKTKKSKKEK